MTDYDYDEGHWEWDDVQGSLEYHFGRDAFGGWIGKLTPLMEGIKSGLQERNMALPKVNQVKEKLGEFRFYVKLPEKPGVADGDWFWGQIHKLTEVSQKTCRRCGGSGEIQAIDGWYNVICDDCAKIENRAK